MVTTAPGIANEKKKKEEISRGSRGIPPSPSLPPVFVTNSRLCNYPASAPILTKYEDDDKYQALQSHHRTTLCQQRCFPAAKHPRLLHQRRGRFPAHSVDRLPSILGLKLKMMKMEWFVTWCHPAEIVNTFYTAGLTSSRHMIMRKHTMHTHFTEEYNISLCMYWI